MEGLRNITEDRPTFVSHLECSVTGETYEPDQIRGSSDTGAPLLVRYDLDDLDGSLSKRDLEDRPWDLWRYREFLPVRRTSSIVSLGESVTPLIPLTRTGRRRLVRPPLLKDESRLPTGSFKARGMAVAVSMAKELDIQRLVISTNGNAGAALAAYGSRAGIETFVFCPEDAPEVNLREIALQGARVWTVNGLIDDCGRIVESGIEPMGWHDVSTLKEPYRIEGKKTMGLELIEQLGWNVPDVAFYPTGGGTGMIGMWKAVVELRAMGWIGDRLPRMVAVQSEGCAPIVEAWKSGAERASRWDNPKTLASGLMDPAPIGDFIILHAIRQSDGFAVGVSDEDITSAQHSVADTDGVLMAPEGAATVAGYFRALDEGWVSPTERVVLFNCGSGLKYPMPPVDRHLDLSAPIDWDAIAVG